MTLDDNSEGRIRIAGNELIVEAKNLDAAALRLRAPSAQGGLGKISFDADTTEKVLMIGAQSPGGGGEFSLNLLRPGGSSIDSDMVKVMEINHEGGIRFHLPISAPNLSGGGITDTMWAPSGLYFTQQQADGNFVTYRTSVPFSKAGNHVTALWSAWGGKI